MGSETFYCSCGQDFDERKFLEIHQQKCPDIKELHEVDEEDDDPEENKPPKGSQFKCDKCYKSFGTTRSLYNHNRNVHPKCLYECATCGRTTVRFLLRWPVFIRKSEIKIID